MKISGDILSGLEKGPRTLSIGSSPVLPTKLKIKLKKRLRKLDKEITLLDQLISRMY